MRNIAMYAGSFDPVTCGHLDIIERASKMFDKVYVTILCNPNKRALFTIEERKDLLKKATSHLDNIVVDASDLLAVEYAASKGVNVMVRGLRATTDFEAELQMAFANQYLDESMEMVFLMTKAHQAFISSSTIKEIAMHHHSVEGLAPSCVIEALQEKFKRPIEK